MNKAGKNTSTTSTNANEPKVLISTIKGLGGPLKHVYSIELITRAMRPNASVTAWARTHERSPS